MKRSRQTVVAILAAVLMMAIVRASAHGGESLPKTERWGVFELTLDGPQDGRPYLDVRLSADFQHQSVTITVPGFYDGEGKYKIRFSPPETGRWTYATDGNRSQLKGNKGALQCVEPSATNHGPVVVANDYYLKYANGDRFYGVGTTAYQWPSVDKSIQEQTVATLKRSPFNKIRMCVFPKWYRYGNDTEPWAYPFAREGETNDFSRPNYDTRNRYYSMRCVTKEMSLRAGGI